MPKGVYKRTKRFYRRPRLSVERLKAVVESKQKLTLEVQVENFLSTLIETGQMDSQSLFYLMATKAQRFGYKLCADQLGIRGTFIYFEKRNGE